MVLSTCTPVHAPQFLLRVALVESGSSVRVVEVLSRCTWYSQLRCSAYDLDRLPRTAEWPLNVVRAYDWLGVAYEQLGKKDQALREYQKFLEIWKEADFSSKEIEDAKVRVAKLKGMGSQ